MLISQQAFMFYCSCIFGAQLRQTVDSSNLYLINSAVLIYNHDSDQVL